MFENSVQWTRGQSNSIGQIVAPLLITVSMISIKAESKLFSLFPTQQNFFPTFFN